MSVIFLLPTESREQGEKQWGTFLSSSQDVFQLSGEEMPIAGTALKMKDEQRIMTWIIFDYIFETHVI